MIRKAAPLFLFLLSLSAASSSSLEAQTSEWAWMNGSPLSGYSGQPGIYGTLGTPAPGNAPGSRRGAVTWVDTKGNLWLFGGEGYGSAAVPAGDLNDLWEFSPGTNQWTWIAGSKTPPQSPGLPTGPVGVYGSEGTPSPNNVPGARSWAVSWTDANGKFWLFGGQGFDSAGIFSTLNDLWEFDPSTSEWTWMGGASTLPSGSCVKGNYGTLGSPSTLNVPGPRSEAVAWTDEAGNLWLFGGYGTDPNCIQGTLNDMWVYSPSAGTWTWAGGSNTIDKTLLGTNGIYGTLGSFAATNFPGSRNWSTGWTDNAGNLWLFGGLGFAASTSGYLNDLWEFKSSSRQWAWMGGSNTAGTAQTQLGGSVLPGVYGSLQTLAPENVPGGRFASAGWSDSQGNSWIFGGKGLDAANNLGLLNDVWRYNPSTQQWAWMGGSSIVPSNCNALYGYCGSTGTFGTPLTPAFGNIPGGRDMAAAWTDRKRNFWLMGGEGWDSLAEGLLNDLWEFSMDSNGLPIAATPTFAPQPGSISGWQDVTIFDSTPGASILYTVNGGAPEQYTGAITVSSTETIQAVASASGYSNSNTAVATYIATFPQAALPIFSVASGTYGTTQTVSISDATPGARIYYGIYSTGPVPTSASTPYTSPITVSSSETIVAVADAPNYLSSDPVTAMYTIWRNPTLGEWAWMGGSSTLPTCTPNTGMCASTGVYGSLKAPASGNVPGGRLGAVSWTGTDGRLWLFGGNGRDSKGNGGYYNDLWVYDPSTGLWAWMSGSSNFVSFSTGGWGQPGVYGTNGQAGSGNTPGSRQYSNAWTGTDGHLWLFGGEGFDTNGTWGTLNDLWEFNPSTNQWTWVTGDSTVHLPRVIQASTARWVLRRSGMPPAAVIGRRHGQARTVGSGSTAASVTTGVTVHAFLPTSGCLILPYGSGPGFPAANFAGVGLRSTAHLPSPHRAMSPGPWLLPQPGWTRLAASGSGEDVSCPTMESLAIRASMKCGLTTPGLTNGLGWEAETPPTLPCSAHKEYGLLTVSRAQLPTESRGRIKLATSGSLVAIHWALLLTLSRHIPTCGLAGPQAFYGN